MSKTPVRTPRARLLVALDEAIRKLGAQAVLVSELVAARGWPQLHRPRVSGFAAAGRTDDGRPGVRALGSDHRRDDGGHRSPRARRFRQTPPRHGRPPRRARRSARRLLPEVAPLYRSLQEDLLKVNARYTNRELAVVVRYITDALEAVARHVEWLQTQPAPTERRRHHAASHEPAGQPAGAGRAVRRHGPRGQSQTCAAAVFPMRARNSHAGRRVGNE